MKVLLMDTCGVVGSLALALDGVVLREAVLPERGASSALLGVIGDELREVGWRVGELDGVGVVHGPGSFTGVRVGLAVAKGLCEAAGLPVAAVSRLAVLARQSGWARGAAVLRAGRGEVYVRTWAEQGDAVERMVRADALGEVVRYEPVAFAEQDVEGLLGVAARATYVKVRAGGALALVEARLQQGGDDLATLDANYVRNEETIYGNRAQNQRKQPVVA